ncbi:hypothetical protein FB567DRAFT_539929 [Paraphoma chrysanthemicola]|uniref:Uncharacterized protein n=1 Tax=Paraphoma chrysanthemicola TaxID=798071 RepID=A0A8K0QT90_9PLEO|nr:hypothetical protein FB567DRAFT_539929 [Paraphoma chrysanthemicola]
MLASAGPSFLGCVRSFAHPDSHGNLGNALRPEHGTLTNAEPNFNPPSLFSHTPSVAPLQCARGRTMKPAQRIVAPGAALPGLCAVPERSWTHTSAKRDWSQRMSPPACTRCIRGTSPVAAPHTPAHESHSNGKTLTWIHAPRRDNVVLRKRRCSALASDETGLSH